MLLIWRKNSVYQKTKKFKFAALVSYVSIKTNAELGKLVVFRPQPFTSEANRMEFLFALYEKYTAGLFAEGKRKKA